MPGGGHSSHPEWVKLILILAWPSTLPDLHQRDSPAGFHESGAPRHRVPRLMVLVPSLNLYQPDLAADSGVAGPVFWVEFASSRLPLDTLVLPCSCAAWHTLKSPYQRDA